MDNANDVKAEQDRQVRWRIYEHFAATGRAPDTTDLAGRTGLTAPLVEASLRRLADAHAIVLAPGSTSIWMAHPFSAVPTAYPVVAAERTYWGNCAWDALGIPALLGVDTETRTQCADSGEPLTLRVRDGQLASDTGVVHFAVPPRRFWENIGFT